MIFFVRFLEPPKNVFLNTTWALPGGENVGVLNFSAVFGASLGRGLPPFRRPNLPFCSRCRPRGTLAAFGTLLAQCWFPFATQSINLAQFWISFVPQSIQKIVAPGCWAGSMGTDFEKIGYVHRSRCSTSMPRTSAEYSWHHVDVVVTGLD